MHHFAIASFETMVIDGTNGSVIEKWQHDNRDLHLIINNADSSMGVENIIPHTPKQSCNRF